MQIALNEFVFVCVLGLSSSSGWSFKPRLRGEPCSVYQH